MLDAKVNPKSKDADHESIYNIRCSTVMGFNLDFGLFRYRDGAGTTHAWVSWKLGLADWQKKMAVDFLLNIVGLSGPLE